MIYKFISLNEEVHHFVVHMDPIYLKHAIRSIEIRSTVQQILNLRLPSTELLAFNNVSILDHDSPMIRSENDLSEYAQLMDTILTARQLILSGGFLESCLKSQLLYMTFIRLKAGLDTEVHLPMDAIYKAEHTTREYFIQTGFTAFEVHDSFLSIVLELNRTVLKDDPFGKEEAQSLFLEKSNYSIFVDRAKITPKIDPSPINIYFWSEMTDMASFLKVLK